MERRKSVGDALIHVMNQIGETWNTPLKGENALTCPPRFFYAFVGAFSWVIYNMADREWVNAVVSFAAESVVAADRVVVYLLVHALFGAWFAWLIAYQERKCSPSRFFLEGLLLPGVAMALLTGSESLFGLLGGDS